MKNSLKGKKVAITGTLSKTRVEIMEDLRSIGAKPQLRITADTDFLIIGDKPGRDKLSMAKKWDVQIMNQETYESIWNNVDRYFTEQAEKLPEKKELPAEYGGW